MVLPILLKPLHLKYNYILIYILLCIYTYTYIHISENMKLYDNDIIHNETKKLR